MAEDKKVLLIGPTPPPMGGIERYCSLILNSSLVDEFKIIFYDITVPIEFRPTAYTDNYTFFIIRDGLINVVKQILFHINNIYKFWKVIISKRPKILHVISCTGMGFWKNIVLILIAKRYSILTIDHIVGEIDNYWDKSSSVKRKIITLSLNKCDRIIVQSDGIKQKVLKMTSCPISVIYNGIDTKNIGVRNNIIKQGENSREILLITVGALGKRKGYFDLLEVAKLIRYSQLNIKMIFIGGGEVDKFRKIVKDKTLEEVINVVGSVDDNIKEFWLQKSDIFVLPTYNEGQPIAILEAMAYGLPIISTKVGSIPEIIKRENGILVLPGSVDQLYNAIKKLSYEESLRKQMSVENRNIAKDKYSIERVIGELKNIYLNI